MVEDVRPTRVGGSPVTQPALAGVALHQSGRITVEAVAAALGRLATAAAATAVLERPHLAVVAPINVAVHVPVLVVVILLVAKRQC